MNEQGAERWRKIVGFPGYLVSSYGRVYHDKTPFTRAGSEPDWMDGKCHRGTSPHEVTHRPRYMARFLHRGRPHVMIRKGLKSYNLSIIDLVARAFIGETPPGFEVEVKNGDKTDTRLENLYYSQYLMPGTKASMAKKRVFVADLYEAALMIEADSGFISVRELCSALRVARPTVENAVRSGMLKVHRPNPDSQRYKIPIVEVFQWLRRWGAAVGAELPHE